MTLNVNDTILYGMDGICTVIGKAEKDFDGQPNEFYILKPLHKANTTIYIPVHGAQTAAKVRRILSPEEIYALIEAMPTADTIWIENASRRKEEYRKILARGDRMELICMIRTLYEHEQKMNEQGKKFHVADERAMKEAEKILYEEFAHVLDITPEQVLPFILEQIELNTAPAMRN